MKKRLRKKRHLGECRQLGFSLTCRLRPGISLPEFDQFTDQFITQAIEANGLTFGGGGSPQGDWSGVISRDHRYQSTTDVDRKAVQSWLQQRPELHSFRLSGFWDLWYGPDPLENEPGGSTTPHLLYGSVKTD